MPVSAPWWVARAASLLEPRALAALELGALWRLRERLEFIRLNVQPAMLAEDLAREPAAARAWETFCAREAEVRAALAHASEAVARRVRSAELGPATFRAHWERLGFARNGDDAGTPADDWLDGLFHLSGLVSADARPSGATLSLSSRAERIADFLAATRPGARDVVFDLGSGSGKLALTVAASALAAVHGVELVGAWVDEARHSTAHLGLTNVDFAEADARDVDLSRGTIFYLYYPFHGAVARTMAERLALAARHRDITLFVAGPVLEFGQYFAAHVDAGALALVERRGEYGEVAVLRSPGARS